MAFMVSPGVNVSETDLTTTVGKGVSTSVGAFAGNFQWGPVNERTLISNEVELVDIFGKPTVDNYVDFFSVANFLSYTNACWVVRVGNANTDLQVNAVSGSTNVRIDNDTDYDVTPLTGSGNWVARYPGAKGNSLAVAYCDSSITMSDKIYNSSNVEVGSWDDIFDSKPGTSDFIDGKGGSLDEMHVVVIDEDGAFSGTKNTIIEKYAFVSKAKGAKSEDGSNNYYVDVINSTSQYVRIGGTYILNSNTSASLDTVWATGTSACESLSGGTDLDVSGNTDDDYSLGYDLFSSAELVDISLVFTGAASVTVAQSVIDMVENRKDCVAFISPEWSDVKPGQTSSAIATNVVSFRNDINRSNSYYIIDSGWKYQYDKYNDMYRWIPLNADVAGLCARTDNARDPWWSPAGFNRGNIRNIVKLAWNPNQAQRDLIYKNSINPVVSFPGEGTILYGDKTGLTKPSAFDRINVRRLFIILEKTIATAAKYSLFEFNDEFTRAQFVSMVEPFLRTVMGRRGIYDFKVVCDETNNTPQVIDNNEFVGDIYIKPAKSINFIQLNFVAVRTGVEFNEVIGQF